MKTNAYSLATITVLCSGVIIALSVSYTLGNSMADMKLDSDYQLNYVFKINERNKKERGTKNDRNHRHFHLGIRRRHRHPDRYPLTEKQRGEKTMEFIVTAIIIAAASVVVTLIATR